MNEKKTNTGLIVVLVILIMLMLFGGTLFILSKMGYISFGKDNEVVDKDDKNNQEENNQTPPTILDDFKISYSEEKYKKENNTGTVKLENTRNLPVIESNNYKHIGDKIVTYLTTVSNTDWSDLTQQSDDRIELYKDYEFPDDEFYKDKTSLNLGVSDIFSTSRLTEKVVSFEYVRSGGMGGVSWENIQGYNFNLDTGDILDFSNIYVDESAKEYFYNTVINELENNSSYTLVDNWNLDENTWKTTVKDKMFEIGNWYFTTNGIKFTFAKYSLGGGANGVIKVELPYNEINQYLKADYKG